MERLTYVTENGTVLFSPDKKDSVTIIDIIEMGDTEYLEQIADTLANREVAAMFYERKYNEKCKELKAYKDTGLTPEQIQEIDKLYREKCTELAKCKSERKNKPTNADIIRHMSDEELAVTIMCPNETGMANIKCDKNDNCNCRQCCFKWLQEEAEEN